MAVYAEQRSTDHVARGVAKLLAQFSRSTKFQNILAVHLRRIQEEEDALWVLVDALSMESTYDFVADLFGKIVGRGRNGLSTADFWISIRAQIAINRSAGRLLDIFKVFGLSAPGYSLRQYSYPPTSVTVWIVEDSSDLNVGAVWDNIRQVRALTKSLRFGYIPVEPGNQALYGWSGDPTMNTGSIGYGWSGGAFGGLQWASFVE